MGLSKGSKVSSKYNYFHSSRPIFQNIKGIKHSFEDKKVLKRKLMLFNFRKWFFINTKAWCNKLERNWNMVLIWHREILLRVEKGIRGLIEIILLLLATKKHSLYSHLMMQAGLWLALANQSLCKKWYSSSELKVQQTSLFLLLGHCANLVKSFPCLATGTNQWTQKAAI